MNAIVVNISEPLGEAGEVIFSALGWGMIGRWDWLSIEEGMQATREYFLKQNITPIFIEGGLPDD